jgi:formylglycine-generating enzyme required for sulfatase activity
MARLHGSILPVLLAAAGLAPWWLGRASAQPAPPPTGAPEYEVTPDDLTLPDQEPPEVPADAGDAVLSAGMNTGRDGMIRVAGGSFTMGSADPRSPANERPRHLETVAPFWMDRTEVTVGAYRACVEANACERPARSSASCTYDAGEPRLPVSCVHWRDADAFCRAAGKRLPREAEWELAGRGSRGTRYPWGGSAGGCLFAATLMSETTGRTCTKGPSRVGAHPAGASPLGFQDLSGNVEEWMSDWYVENLAYGGAPAAGASHVLRGGGWQSAPSAARTTSRNWGSSLEAGPNVGFRCAADD